LVLVSIIPWAVLRALHGNRLCNPSAVFQDCSILNYSVAENISFSETYSENRINEILYSLNMEDKVNSFKYGLDTSITRMLDAEGSDISGGERQKLVIARALYKNTPICMFDEPTSALSATSEYNIYKSFSDLTENKTVFYISHRLASCKLCEKIILLNKGQIKESGSFDELMSKNVLFTEMYNAQAEYYRN
jgi:ABC-type multidrug transport system fused ATPase/permease subunit